MPWKRFFLWLIGSIGLIILVARFAPGGEKNKVAFSTRPGAAQGQVRLTAMLPVRFVAYIDKGQPEGVMFCTPQNEEVGTLPVGGRLQAIRLHCRGGVELTVAGVEFDAH